MPTYEYRCNCGVEFEEFQSITAERVAACPECGQNAQRLISAGTGLIFKGSGFYITDYKGKGAKGNADTRSDAKSDSPTTTTASAETKAAGSKSGDAAASKAPSTTSGAAKSN